MTLDPGAYGVTPVEDDDPEWSLRLESRWTQDEIDAALARFVRVPGRGGRHVSLVERDLLTRSQRARRTLGKVATVAAVAGFVGLVTWAVVLILVVVARGVAA